MIKMNVLYPNVEGARFDQEYYETKHLPMLANLLGTACLYYQVEKGLGGGRAGSPSPYVASCSIYSESLDTLQKALAPHSRDVTNDIKNYTDVQPIVWFSNVVEHRS